MVVVIDVNRPEAKRVLEAWESLQSSWERSERASLAMGKDVRQRRRLKVERASSLLAIRR